MRQIFIPFAFLLFSLLVQAQQQRTQHNFAQTYLGIATQYYPAGGYTHVLEKDGILSERSLPAGIEPRLQIGGLHFWQKADFYISIPIRNIMLSPERDLAQRYSTGIATGARYFPLPLRDHSIRPFAGFNWSTPSYWQQLKDSAAGPVIRKNTILLEAGFIYTGRKYRQLDFSIQYMPYHLYRYPISRTEQADVKLPALSFKLGYRFVFDFTQGSNKEVLDKFYQHLQNTKRLDGFTFAAGPSVAFLIKASDYMAQNRPFLQNPMPGGFYIDPSLGYYLHRADMEFRIGYKSIAHRQEAYDLQQTLKSRSVSLEAFKFLFDYKGFVPFVGAGISQNSIRYSETDRNIDRIEVHKDQLAPVVTCGWDIRPSQSEILVLRTNVRYTPALKLTVNERRMPLQQLEVNFIQLVIYPERIMALRKFNP